MMRALTVDVINGDDERAHVIRSRSYCDCHSDDPSATFGTECGMTIHTGHGANRTFRRLRLDVPIVTAECVPCVTAVRHCPTCDC
jgi:hypothetical protein